MERRTFLKNLLGIFALLSFNFLPFKSGEDKRRFYVNTRTRYWLYGSKERGCTGHPPISL